MGRWRWLRGPSEQPDPIDTTGPATQYPGRTGCYPADQAAESPTEQVRAEQKRDRMASNRGDRWRRS